MLASYHVHSRWSDGEGEVVDFVRAARAMGLDEIGLSDHYVLTSDGRKVYWSMPLDVLDDYVDAVQSAAMEGGEDVVVRLGLEADYFPETADALKDLLDSHPFDYVIGSVHMIGGFPIDDAAENWETLNETERDSVIRDYWVQMCLMAESGLFDFAGHLDLTKKFGFMPSTDMSDEISATLDAIARADMAFELNTAGWRKPCKEAYPSQEIIRACFERGIPVVVTADAHKPEDLIRDYDAAYRLLREIGYTESAFYAGRNRIMYPLDAFV